MLWRGVASMYLLNSYLVAVIAHGTQMQGIRSVLFLKIDDLHQRISTAIEFQLECSTARRSIANG